MIAIVSPVITTSEPVDLATRTARLAVAIATSRLADASGGTGHAR